MSARFQRVIDTLLNVDTEISENEAYSELIAAYVTYELAGGDPQARFPEIYVLLATRPALQELYQMVRAVFTMEQQGQLSPPPRPVQFDLSFLRPAVSTTAPAKQVLWEKVGDVYRLVAQLTAELGERVVNLTNLDALLMPYHRLAPAPAGLQTRSPSEMDLAMREMQELPSPEHNRRIILYMGLTHDQKGTIMVQVEDMDPGQPLKASIALRSITGRLLERIPTSGDGTAIFVDLAPNNYVIQVKENTNLWEFHLDLIPKRVA